MNDEKPMVNVITYSSAKARMRGQPPKRDWVDLTCPENACSDRTRPSFSGPFFIADLPLHKFQEHDHD